MNKTKKLAFAVASIVMAGTMALSMAACGGNSGGGNSGGGNSGGNGGNTGDGGNTGSTLPADLTPSVDASGKLTYTAGTTVKFAVGYNSADTGITYSATNATDLAGYTLMNTTVSQNTLKPAWAGVQQAIGITISDKYNGKSTGSNISDIKQTYANEGGLGAVDILTASAATINAEAAANDAFLDLSDYLDYMPNYKAFLEASPIIQMSLMANADGTMYMFPYFDGNDDIEKFVLMRKDLVETLLAADLPTSGVTYGTFAAQAAAKNNATTKPVESCVGTEASVESFMGTTGSWLIDTTDPAVLTSSTGGALEWGNDNDAVTSNATVKVKVDYDKALTDAKSSEAGSIGAILTAAGIDTTTLTSGNIIDIQNLAINQKSGDVSGEVLLKVLRRYIDVAYLNEAGTASFYTEANGLTRASVFNSASAAWDVDLYVALGRCFVTSGDLLGEEVVSDAGLRYLVAGRAYTTQRTGDVYSLAGELYGARGLESRYNFTYIDSNGDAQDARSNAKTYDAVEKMNALAHEGLFNTANNIEESELTSNYVSNKKSIQTLSMHDYCQTQTSHVGFKAAEQSLDYNLAPILTPVSKWDTDDDGTAETIMRFTESWRGVKTDGVAVSKAAVRNNPEKLSAVLTFIDYLYSVDGQIMMTYGPQSTTGNTAPNGTWYANVATGVSLDEVVDSSKTIPATNKIPAQYTVKDEYKEQYFVYNGQVLEGNYYNGKQIPILTDENLAIFNGKSEHNFTNHARKYLGTTLPLGNKDQGFEYLCTATCGIVGSRIVNVALNNGTVKHQVQSISQDTYWYTLSPSQFPYDNDVTNAIKSGDLAVISGLGDATNNLYGSSSSIVRNLLLDLMYYGYDNASAVALPYVTMKNVTLPTSGAACVTLTNSFGLTSLVGFKQEAWADLLAYYNSAN